MEFTAQDTFNLVIENNEKILKGKEVDIYLQIIEKIKDYSKQGKLFIDIPIERSTISSCYNETLHITSDKLANKIMFFLRKNNFNCKIKSYRNDSYLTNFKSLRIKW